MRVHALTCGWLTSARGMFLEGTDGHLRVPVPSFLIEHPRGLALFDTGMHPAARTHPDVRLGRAAPFFTVEMADDDALTSRLAALGVDPARVQWLVNSHLHFDHAGGNALVPNARLVVQRREWDAAHDDDVAAANGINALDWDLGHDVQTVDGEHDLFGDGRVVCLPTHGHTPGHQSLRLRLDDGGDVVLTSDACYLRETLEQLHLPPIVHDRDQMLASLLALRRLRDAGARLVFGHDPDAWATMPALLT
ncbi:MAG TPA: N-acyl homoserine lactonase family protein [Candidatus Binatia bacterium]|jgi:glyoxylase-like metal-dependent hydrolase (beta-lactamase superfamily II)|nr:N-acyl homoserine lactonase family protein [Candidatus Binatia bacterium]